MSKEMDKINEEIIEIQKSIIALQKGMIADWKEATLFYRELLGIRSPDVEGGIDDE